MFRSRGICDGLVVKLLKSASWRLHSMVPATMLRYDVLLSAVLLPPPLPSSPPLPSPPPFPGWGLAAPCWLMRLCPAGGGSPAPVPPLPAFPVPGAPPRFWGGFAEANRTVGLLPFDGGGDSTLGQSPSVPLPLVDVHHHHHHQIGSNKVCEKHWLYR